MTLYSARTADGSFRITKFDDDLNPEASYLTSPEACECPAGVRPTCRHRQMLPEFLAYDAVDSPLFLDWDNHEWVDTASISDTTIEGLAERPLNPAVNELMDLAPEASSITKADLAKAFNAVAEAVGQEELKLPIPEGVTILGLDDLVTVHNTIADVVGEPEAKIEPKPSSTGVRRI